MQTSQEPTAGSASAKLVPIMEAVLGENAAREHVQEIAACEVKARLALANKTSKKKAQA